MHFDRCKILCYGEIFYFFRIFIFVLWVHFGTKDEEHFYGKLVKTAYKMLEIAIRI